MRSVVLDADTIVRYQINYNFISGMNYHGIRCHIIINVSASIFLTSNYRLVVKWLRL